jgi:uncharacterized protein
VQSTSFFIDVGEARTTAIAYRADAPRALLVFAHGAGAPQTHPWIVAVARALCARGVDVVTFNFLYAEAKRRSPDRNDVLETTWRAAIQAVCERHEAPRGRLFVGGKSMGGRIATQIAAADGAGIAGVVLLGYPLHPPGKPEQLRAAHLPLVRAPMLFVQGSRDAFGTPDELAPILGTLVNARLFVVRDADHSFSVPKRSGETSDALIARVADEVARFTE